MPSGIFFFGISDWGAQAASLLVSAAAPKQSFKYGSLREVAGKLPTTAG
jgi:hypothetical protein